MISVLQLDAACEDLHEKETQLSSLRDELTAGNKDGQVLIVKLEQDLSEAKAKARSLLKQNEVRFL